MGYKMLKMVKQSLEEKGYRVDKIVKSGKGNDVHHTMSVTSKNGDHSWWISITSIGGWHKYA